MKYLLATLMIMTSVLFGVQVINSPSPQEADEKRELSSESPSVKFVLKYHEGSVSLFEGEEIIETFGEVNYSALPYADRESLDNGIVFDTIDEVYELIEDFDG